jgi:hypothetical protein
MPNPSTIGVLQARNAAASQAHSNHLYDVVIRLSHQPTANGGNGTVAIYNVGSETTTYNAVQLRADVGMFLGAGNNLNGASAQPPYAVQSPFTGTLGENVSNTVISVRGTSTIFALGGPAVRIRGGAAIDLGDSGLASVFYEQPGLTAPYPYAIEVLAQTHALRYTGSMENFPGLLKTHAPIAGLFLECYAAHDPATARIFLADGATLSGGRIDVVPTAGSGGGLLIKAQPNTSPVVSGMDISLYAQGIDLTPAGTLTGCTIRSTQTVADTLAGISAGTRAGNVILATDGVYIDNLVP